jgi:hypothetical protein
VELLGESRGVGLVGWGCCGNGSLGFCGCEARFGV